MGRFRNFLATLGVPTSSYQHLEDEELMQLVRSENFHSGRGAFEEVYRRYASQVFSYASSVIWSEAKAEEATQQILLKIYENARSYDPTKAFRPWMWTVARNHCRDLLKKRREQLVGGDMDILTDHEDESIEDMDAQLVYKSELQDLQDCLDEIPSAQKEVFLLRVNSGLSLEEIAQITGKSIGAIKGVLHRAKSSLTLCLRGKHE